MSHTTELARALEPLGLMCRMFRGEADLQANVDLNNVCALADGQEWVDTVEAARNWIANYENGDLCQDMVMVETADGARDGGLVAKGLVSWWRNEAGEWHYGMGGWVHPDWRRRGVGRAVLGWTEQRAREMAAQHTHNGEPAYLTGHSDDLSVGHVMLLQRAGYQGIRHGYTMLRALSEPVPQLALPEGVEVRPVQREHIRQIWNAFSEAFRDHWGYREWSEHDYQGFLKMPDLDPSLWVIAWQGDEVAGGCINAIPTQENEAFGWKRGWLGEIAVRRPWRKRGIAKATIARSFELFKNRGLTEAGLGVDAQNPNGALALYEGMGFRVHKSGTSYRKPLAGAALAEH